MKERQKQSMDEGMGRHGREVEEREREMRSNSNRS